VGHHRRGRFLQVVRREAVVLRAHQGLEVAPRLACDETEQAAILGAKEMTLGRHGLAEPVGHQRRGQPQGRRGLATARLLGRAAAIRARSIKAMNGLAAIPVRNTSAPARAPRPAAREVAVAAVSHSRRRRCVNTRRTRVRAMA